VTSLNVIKIANIRVKLLNMLTAKTPLCRANKLTSPVSTSKTIYQGVKLNLRDSTRHFPLPFTLGSVTEVGRQSEQEIASTISLFRISIDLSIEDHGTILQSGISSMLAEQLAFPTLT
jgi:hypothetical protein